MGNRLVMTILQVTVRAFSSERRFLNNLHGKIDATTKVRDGLPVLRWIVTSLFIDVVQCVVHPVIRKLQYTDLILKGFWMTNR